MSQEKVDKYKQEKANRDKIIKKEKKLLFVEKIIGGLVCLAVVVWIGYSAYGVATKPDPDQRTQTEIEASSINDYLNSLSAQK